MNHTIFNEDMIYAAGVIQAGYAIAYAADAKVIHSHNYSGWQQFTRNFDLGVSHVQYPAVFDGVPPEGEGMKLVKKTAVYLAKIRTVASAEADLAERHEMAGLPFR